MKKDNLNTKKTKKFRISNLIIMIVGILILTYPLASNLYNKFYNRSIINNYEEKINNMSQEDIDEYNAWANKYNKELSQKGLSINDPYSEDYIPKGNSYIDITFDKLPIGYVVLPTQNVDFPIYEGAGEDILQNYVGHIPETSLPVGGSSTHSVLTAHRGLPGKRLFRDLDLLQEGDIFIIHSLDDVLYYKVTSTNIIEPNDISKMRIIDGKDQVTLLTCHPYMINSHRMIVTGERTEYTEEMDKELKDIIKGRWWKEFWHKYKEYIIAGVVILLILIRKIVKKIYIKRKLSKESLTNEDNKINNNKLE